MEHEVSYAIVDAIRVKSRIVVLDGSKVFADDVTDSIKFVIIDEIDLNLRTNYFTYDQGSVIRGLFHCH